MSDLKILGLRIDWNKIDEGSYLRNIPALSSVESLEFRKPITFFVGENGSGKSTLIEAMAVQYGFNPEGGTKNYSFSTYDSHSELHDALTLVRSASKAQWGYFLRAESFYNVATQENEYSKSGGVPQFYHSMSHGESFLAMAKENFKPNGLYLLDEPEAALSPQRQTLQWQMSQSMLRKTQRKAQMSTSSAAKVPYPHKWSESLAALP